MMIQSIRKVRASKEVTILDAGNYSHCELYDFAMAAAGENSKSLFGMSCTLYDGGQSAVVKLFTD